MKKQMLKNMRKLKLSLYITYKHVNNQNDRMKSEFVAGIFDHFIPREQSGNFGSFEFFIFLCIFFSRDDDNPRRVN